MTLPSRTITDPRPAEWVTHGTVAPEWAAVPELTIIEVLAKGCHGDPERPLIIIEDG